MRNILIIYPHWHPANLAGVHRPRLIGNFLPEFGWHPIVLTVEQAYFEETPDRDFKKTFREHYEVHRVKALPVSKLRIVGDIGLRSFLQLYKGAKSIIEKQSIDFIWIPIPSFYTAILGRMIHDKSRVPYGIDYIDPWVRDITNQNNWRARLSQKLAKLLEPYAVKKASLISGVSIPYYWPVIERNFKQYPIHVGMPYGFDPNDHKILLEDLALPWDDHPGCKPWIYAGAFLPNAHLFLEAFFQTISKLRTEGKWDEQVRLFFIGTGPYPAKQIASYARDYGLSDIVVEDRSRHPFLHILNFLSRADKIMLIGSTEKHYTASKTFQCLLSERPVFAMLHAESSAVKVMKEARGDAFLVSYQSDQKMETIEQQLKPILLKFQQISDWSVNLKALEPYSARESAKALVNAVDEVLEHQK